MCVDTSVSVYAVVDNRDFLLCTLWGKLPILQTQLSVQFAKGETLGLYLKGGSKKTKVHLTGYCTETVPSKSDVPFKGQHQSILASESKLNSASKAEKKRVSIKEEGLSKSVSNDSKLNHQESVFDMESDEDEEDDEDEDEDDDIDLLEDDSNDEEVENDLENGSNNAAPKFNNKTKQPNFDDEMVNIDDSEEDDDDDDDDDTEDDEEDDDDSEEDDNVQLIPQEEPKQAAKKLKTLVDKKKESLKANAGHTPLKSSSKGNISAVTIAYRISVVKC